MCVNKGLFFFVKHTCTSLYSVLVRLRERIIKIPFTSHIFLQAPKDGTAT